MGGSWMSDKGKIHMRIPSVEGSLGLPADLQLDLVQDPLRHHRQLADLHRPFGSDRFGVLAERFARFFGTPRFIIGQTILVAIWIALNALVVALRWDPYPFILLNPAFSTQAAYAAPLILLAATRQADRDKLSSEAAACHRQEESDRLVNLLEANTTLTNEVARLSREIRALVAGSSP